MKKQLLLLSLLAMVLFSCDKEDEEPSLFLEGSYENVFPTSAESPTYRTVITFSSTGDLLIELFASPAGSDERCLVSYSEGTYRLQGEKYTETIVAAFGPDPAAVEISEECIPKSQFVKNSNPQSTSSSKRLVMDDSKENFTIYYPCNDMLSLSNCIGDLTYTKLE